MVREVGEAMRRHDPFVVLDGEQYPIADYPGGVQRIVIQHGTMEFKPLKRHYDTTIISSLGGSKNRIDQMTEQAVRNFGRQVLRIERADSSSNGRPFLCEDGAIDGVYVTDVEIECTKLVLGARTAPVTLVRV
jgi:hypothetical protein